MHHQCFLSILLFPATDAVKLWGCLVLRTFWEGSACLTTSSNSRTSKTVLFLVGFLFVPARQVSLPLTLWVRREIAVLWTGIAFPFFLPLPADVQISLLNLKRLSSNFPFPEVATLNNDLAKLFTHFAASGSLSSLFSVFSFKKNPLLYLILI